MPRYYRLAHDHEMRTLSDGNTVEWPYEIWLCLERGIAEPVSAIEGTGEFTTNAGDFSPERALGPNLRFHFARAKGEWLIPIVEALAARQYVSEREVCSRYRQLHGTDPRFYDRVPA